MSVPTPDPPGVVDPEQPAGGWTPLLQAAAELGRDVWLEQQVFALLGKWAATAEAPSVVVHLGAHSRRHGRHSQRFFARLPELSVFDPDAAIRPPGPGTDALFESLEELTGSDRVRVAVHNRVLLPALVLRYREQLGASSPVAEPSLQRCLRMVIADDLDEIAAGDALLAELDDPGDDAAVADAERAALDALRRSQHLTA